MGYDSPLFPILTLCGRGLCTEGLHPRQEANQWRIPVGVVLKKGVGCALTARVPL